MGALIAFLQRNPGVLFNLIFSFASWFYGLFLRREILSYAIAFNPAIENPPPNYAIGAILLAVIVAETVGIFFKTRDIRYRLSQPDGAQFETPLEGKGVMVLLAILHIVGVFFIGALMLSAFGMTFEGSGWMLFFALLIRELYVWYLAFLTTSERSREYAPVSTVKKFIANACLVCWGLVAYTIVWERIAVNFVQYFNRGGFFLSFASALQFFFVLIGVILAALTLFVPTRFAFILEESTFMKNSRDRMYFSVSLGIAVASAILSYAI